MHPEIGLHRHIGPRSCGQQFEKSPKVVVQIFCPDKTISKTTANLEETKNMKQIRVSFKMIGATVLLALTVGCATTNSNSDLLSAAGFKLLPADTPRKQQLLQTLTPGKLTLITWKGKQF